MYSWKRPSALLASAVFVITSFVTVRPTKAIFLDEARTIQLSGVFYNQLRLRTVDPRRFNTQVGDWTMMQHRYFVDPQLLVQVQPWIRHVPFGEEFVNSLQIENARFFFNPRFEYDGVYDYGPEAFSNNLAPRLQKGNRFQLFEVYGDFQLLGKLNIRVGRQNLSWGETDTFRLLDRINPLDNGFGGFLVPLDERRRPLTMLRATMGLGDYPQWELYNTAIEMFIAPDKRLPASAPGPTPFGVQGAPSPRGFPPTLVASLAELGKGAPRGNQLERPDVNFKDSRWGVRLMGTYHDISLSLAYISTYPDGATPALRLNSQGDPIIKLKFPKVQIVGLTATSPLPAPLNYTVFRMEVAEFFDEPFFIEKQNFQLGVPIPKRRVLRASIGLDHNQWLRALNPQNTFFISGQMFYSGIRGDVNGLQVPLQKKSGQYIDLDRNSFTNTLTINTLYSAGAFFNIAQVQPQMVFLYDWEGSWLTQPAIIFIRDPFRFRVEYNWLEGRFVANTNTGIGTLKDKDNLAFRIDYLL